MGLGRSSQLLVLSLVAMTTACEAAAARVTLASGASRTCAGETRVRMLSNLRQPATNGQEQVAAMSESLSVRLTGGQYEVRRSNSIPGGQALLTAQIRPDGTVVDANMSGSMPMVGEVQRLAMLAARMLPERLVMGREFRPGDNLYANVDAQDLVASMMGEMAVPPGFQFQLTGTMPFTGATGDSANRSLNFAGQLQASGTGVVNGQTMALAFPGRASIIIDATTGLMRSMTTEGTMSVKVNGITQTEMRMTQTMTCTIASAA